MKKACVMMKGSDEIWAARNAFYKKTAAEK
jgi:hypothetical protein